MYCHVLRPFFLRHDHLNGDFHSNVEPGIWSHGMMIVTWGWCETAQPNHWMILGLFHTRVHLFVTIPPKNIKKYITSNYSPVIEHCNWTSTIYRWFVQFKPRFIGDFRLPATFNYPRVSPRVFRPPFSHNTYYETYFYDQYPLDVSMKNNTLPAGKPLPHLAPHWWFFPR